MIKLNYQYKYLLYNKGETQEEPKLKVLSKF